MGQSLPPNPDPRDGGSISGLTIIVGLVLLILAGSGFAVATYLAMGPPSLRRQAIAKALAEGQTQQAASDDPAASATGKRDDQTPLPVDVYPAALPAAAAGHPADSSQATSSTTGERPSADAIANAVRRPDHKSGPSGLHLTELSPLEIVGVGANAGDWRGAVKIGAQAYEHAVSLRPVEDQDVVQIAFDVKARFARFCGLAATVGDEARDATGAKRDQPQAVFRVYGDGNLLWESELLTGSGRRQGFECDIRGVEVLTLVAESQSPANISNFAWCDPTLLPAEKTAPNIQPRPPRTP